MTHVSIVDIARLAEVSPSTVSRALQDHPRISAERRAEIQTLAERLGYRPSQVARGLVTGRTHTLGVVASDVTDPFVAEVLKGAEAAAREPGMPCSLRCPTATLRKKSKRLRCCSTARWMA